MLNFFKKYTVIFLSALLLLLSSCESKIGSCTDDPGDGSTTVPAKTINIFSNNSKDLWQTQLADWQDTSYYTNGQDITVYIGTGSYGSVDAHRGKSGRVTHPCNICSKIVKYDNGKIAYQTPNCICGPKIYVPPNQTTQSFQYHPNTRGEFRAIETIQPQCEIMPGYLEQAHFGISNANERVTCEKSASNKIITVGGDGNINPLSPMTKNLSTQQYTCIPMEWALNLGGVDNLGRSHPNFTTNSYIQSFLGENILRNHLGVEKYYSKATYLLTADFKNITADVGGSQQSGYEIVHFPVDYYEKELSQIESDRAKITQLKDVNYHQVNNCNASNGLSLYMGLFPPNSDMPGYNNKIYAYHLYSFNQICRSYYRGICNNAVTEFKLKTAPPNPAPVSGVQPSLVQPQILPTFLTNIDNLTPISIPAGYKVKFKIYDNYYTDNNSSDGYLVNITSGIQTQNTDNQQQDEGIIGNAKNKIDSIFIGARDQSYHFEPPKQSQQDITEIIDSAKKNGLIRATYENFTRKNQLLIRLVMSLFLLFYAVSYLMGLSEMNQKELVVRVFKIAIVFAFLDPALVGITNERPDEYTKTTSLDPSNPQYTTNNYATLGFLLYQKYVVNFVLDGLNTLTNIVSGLSQQVIAGFTANDGADALQREGISFSQNVNFAYFDKILEKIFNIKTVGSIISAFFTKLVVGAVLLVVFLFFLVKTIFKLLVTYILNWLQIILALSLGPIFFLFLLFSRTKSFFTKWLAFVFARGLDIVILLALTFPFLSVIYDDLLLLIGQPACLKAIGPSFLRIGVWFQGDSVNDDLNNFFGYMFALARDIALVYMVSLIASYAPKISGKIINIAEQQNTAEMSSGATKIASETTAEALKGIASSIKFANQSYVGGMTKSYLKQGALGVSDFIGTTRLAKFAKNTAVSTAQQAFKGFTNVVNAKNAKTAGTKLFDTAFGTNFSKQRGDTSADATSATGGVSAGDVLAGGDTVGTPAASAGATSATGGVSAGAGVTPVTGADGGVTPVTGADGGVPAGGFAGRDPDVDSPLITEVKSSHLPSAPPSAPPAGKEYIDAYGNKLPSPKEPPRAFSPFDSTQEAARAVAGVGDDGTGSGSAGGGVPNGGAVNDDTNEGTAPQKPKQSKTVKPFANYVGGVPADATASTDGTHASGASSGAPTGSASATTSTDGAPPTHTMEATKLPTASDASSGTPTASDSATASTDGTHASGASSGAPTGSAPDNGAGMSRFMYGADVEAPRGPSKIIGAEGEHGSSPPSDYSPLQQNISESANDQFKPAFLDKIKSTAQGGLKSLQKTISNDLSLNKVLDLFIESQNEKLRYLNEQFGQSGEESNIEKELQQAFKKFKQDFTSTKTEFSQSQTAQITQYQQEAEKLKNDINSNKITSEQKEKLIALATQNNQKDLAKKLKNQSTELEKPQKEQLIKLVEQDSFVKQEPLFVSEITKVIIANDNHSRVSDITKQQVFKQVVDELKPTTAIPETIKQEVLTKFATQLDDKNLDSTTKQIIAELKTELQKATSTPAKQQQILVKFLAKQSSEVKEKVLEKLELTAKEDTIQQQQEERRNFFNEIKKEVAKEEIFKKVVDELKPTTAIPETIKQEVLTKFATQLDDKNLDPATKQIIAELKTELQKATSTPAQQQQILVKFLADKSKPQQAKEEALKILESITNTQDEASSKTILQERRDFINEVKIVTLATRLQDEEISIQEKQQVLVQFLADRTNVTATAKLEVVLQKIKEETEKEEEKMPLKQERTDFIAKVEEQTIEVETFAQHYNPEPKSDGISQEEIDILQKSKLVNDLNAEYLIKNNEKHDEIFKNAPLYDNEDYIEQTLTKISDQDKQDLQEYLEKREELLEKISQEPLSVENIEKNKEALKILLNLMGVDKYNIKKLSSILFATQDTSLSMTDQIEKMYTNLERPLAKMQRQDELLRKILTAINEDIQKELSQRNTAETTITDKKQKQIEKNKLTIKKLQARKKSFKSLFAMVKKAIEKS